MSIPYFTAPSTVKIADDHTRLRYMVERIAADMRRLRVPGGFTDVRVAITDSIIPARVGYTPGGPVSVRVQYLDEISDELKDDITVDVRSWVKTDSADPADETNGELFVFIAQDQNAVWWFIAQDCTVPPTDILTAQASADLVVTTTIQPVPGTSLVLPTYEGVYSYTFEAEVVITDVLGNQVWDLEIGLYDQTDSIWLGSASWAGAGTPLFNPSFSRADNLKIDAGNAGHTVVLGVVRASTVGTVTLTGTETRHAITGPL